MNQLIQRIRILSRHQLEEINHFIDVSSDFFTKSTIMKDDGSSGITNEPEVRSSSYLFIQNGERVTDLIHQAMNNGLGEYRKRVQKLNPMFSYWPVPGSPETFFGREEIQLLRYRPGEKYVFHHDQADFDSQHQYFRTLSTVLYLNDEFEGGATEFLHKTFKPKAGYALYFPSNWCYPHSGQEVLTGEKRVAVTWWYALREKM